MKTKNDVPIIEVETMLDVPGLVFRGFRGPEDYPLMVAIVSGSCAEDGVEWVPNPADTARDYAHLENCDPYTDMIFVEVGDETVGYGRTWWHDEIDGARIYGFFAHLLPKWRGKSIRRTMANWLMARAATLAADHPADKKKLLQAWASETETHWTGVLTDAGFEIVRYGLEMTRPLPATDIPDCPLPAEFEVRPGTLAEWRQIWEAAREAFRDHWGGTEWSESSFQSWQGQTTFEPRLWQVAWHGDEVAGGVLNFIDHKENETFERRRGYTETIFVRRPYRGKGLAKALIASSFRVLEAKGMTEAALGVDAENLSGALHLYRKMGFRKEKQHMTFRKELVS